MKRYIVSLLCFMVAVCAWADVTVKGVVYEPDGEPAIGATILQKSKKTNGTATNLDGEFTLKVSDPNATLVVSYIGMETQEVKLEGRTNITVKLKAQGVALSEVVVVGYGTQKKINATGAVKTIGNDVLDARPVTNAVQGLQGAVAGLNITSDAGGELGGSMNINIRGVGSIGEGSNSAPLILIDGMEGDLSTINPNDIENISVLKDAAAASIYGSRAPFGVVLVTTKSGHKGGTRVNYTGSVRFQNPMKVPHMADSYTMALMINDAAVNSGENARIGNGQLGKILSYQRGELQYATEGYQNDMAKWKSHRESWGNTNWYDVYLKPYTTSQEHNLSITGGNDGITYFLSGNYLGQTGLFNFADEKYQRLSLNSKVNVTFNKYVSLNWSTRLIVTENEKPSALNTLFYHNIARREATIPVYTPTGEYHPDSMIESLLNGGRQISKGQQLYNQAHLIIEPVKDWKLHAEVNSRIENNPFTKQFNPIYYTRPDGERQGYQVLATGMAATYGFYGNGDFKVYPDIDKIYYEKRQGNVNYLSTNFYTDYNFTLADKHNFKFLAGMQTEYYSTDITRVANTNIISSEKPYLPQTSINDNGVMTSESKGEWSSVGIFGRLNYNYEDRYMVELNMRGDGASRFPKNQRWGYFPSVSAGWNVANEKFFESVADKGFNYLKLRASYGQLGNQNTTSFYPFYQQMSTTPGVAVIGGNQVMTLPMYSPFSSSLTWEKIENIGAGIDFGFWNNRLSGSFDVYQRTTKDMVGPSRALSQIYGAAAPKTNNAELRTRGWEFEASWRDRIGKDFNYGISVSLSDFQTVVSKYDSPDNKVDNWYQGKEYGEIWGYKTVGIAKSDDEMRAYLAQHAQGPSMGSGVTSIWGGGDLMYADLDNSGVVEEGSRTLDNHGDLVKIGNTTPRYAYSFTLEAQWKFIDVRAYFQGIGKRDYFIAGNTFFGFGKNEWQNSLFMEHLDYFRLAGAPLGANYENPYYARLRWDANNQLPSDRFVQDASYLRFKNLQVGFNLPANTKLAKLVRKARLYGAVENLFCLSNLRIFDPEALSAENGDYNDGVGRAYPQYRTYSVGLEVTF